MKTFVSAEDMEAVAERGQQEYIVGPDTVLTDMARRRADNLGIRLVEAVGGGSNPAPAMQSVGKAIAGGSPYGGRPKGCQSRPASKPGTQVSDTMADSSSQVLDKLVQAIQSRGSSGSRRA